MRILVLLQNAWSHKARRSWRYDLWVRALRRSRSGQRLARIFGECWNEVNFGNTTPLVGEGPDSVLPPDFDHVASLFYTFGPRTVVACGQQAERVAVDIWGGPLLVLPHPASRTLTNDLLDIARSLLCGQRPFSDRIALRQAQGEVVREHIAVA
jgi:hypothetical protein